MEITISANWYTDEKPINWWIDMGMGFGTTKYHKYRKYFTIGLILFTIYIRWTKKQ